MSISSSNQRRFLRRVRRGFLLLCALPFLLSACGAQTTGAFRTLRVVGTRHYGVICRAGDQLAPRVNAAMEVLAADGTLSSISTRWLGRDAITLEGDADARAALGEPDDTRTLIVGVELDFRPMSYEENGALTGMNVEIAYGLGRVLGCPVTLQEISAAEVGAQLSSGNIDCALGFDGMLVDAGKYDVGVRYMDSNIVLAVPADSELRRLKDLKGVRIGCANDPGVVAAVKADEKIVKYAEGATVYLSAARCIGALQSGWCTAIAMDELRLTYALAAQGQGIL
jgi:ABC-type amino acid transport substrate-binding protein